MVANTLLRAGGVGVIMGGKTYSDIETHSGKGASAQRCDNEGVEVHDGFGLVVYSWFDN